MRRLIERIRAWHCRRYHKGAINLNSLSYECPECFRIVYHGLPSGFRVYPKAAGGDQASKVRSIGRRRTG